MAWIDDRAWCHPKLVGLSDRAFRVWVNGISYSAGMSTKGVLTAAQQKLLGSTKKVREELVEANVWLDGGEAGSVVVKDWDEHNGKRDERRAADRERKRKSRGQSAGTSPGLSAGPAHVDSSEGSEGSDRTTAGVADEMADLANAGWSGNQIRAASNDLARALAWLAHAEADPDCRSVGALAWSMFRQGGWPEEPKEPQPTLANGAVGTRSASKPVTYTCPECEDVFDSYKAREDHVDATHRVPAPPPPGRTLTAQEVS